jgi:type VI protein secretion system component VasK
VSTFLSQILNVKFLVVNLVCGTVMAAVAYGVTRLLRGAFQVPWRCLARICLVVALVAVVVWLPRRYPPEEFLNPTLPDLFSRGFWVWVYVLAVGSVISLAKLVRTLKDAQSTTEAQAGESATSDPEVDAAWREIRSRLAQAQIDLGRQRVYLILAPNEDWTDALVRSAGLQLFVQAPDVPAPIHAYATPDGLLLSVTGASAFGTQDSAGSARLEALCRQLQSREAELPAVRGIAVLFPISWAAQPESVKWAAAIREDIRSAQRAAKVRCPIFAVFVEMETIPGTLEFISRMPKDFLGNRVGFAVPGSIPFSGELVSRGLTWTAGWFHSWVLNRMSEDPLDQASNNELFSLGQEVRRFRKRLRSIMEAAFSTHHDAVSVLFQGCYFTATGSGPAQQAFTAGLFRGPRSRIIASHLATRWGVEALDEDRRYRRIALGVALGGGLMTLVAWLYIIRETQNPLWWIGLVALILGWIYAGICISSR